MLQIETRQPETAPLTYRVDPMGALVGYAVVHEVPRQQRTPSPPRETPHAAFVPSCPFQWSAPTSKAMARATEQADATSGDATAPGPQDPPRSWLGRLWSRYVAWRERQRVVATWETLDTRTLRDIGALPDEVDGDLRSIPYWGWHTIL
jgi:uncharacterized protein YjiS (DUF1127 family)